MFATRVLQAAKRMKKTTGIVGLEVVPNARDVLINLYEETLKSVQAVPAHTTYRRSVESFTKYRLQVCREHEDLEEIERRIDGGQAEELIELAKDELALIPQYAEWKLWEDAPEGKHEDYETIETEVRNFAPEADMEGHGSKRAEH